MQFKLKVQDMCLHITEPNFSLFITHWNQSDQKNFIILQTCFTLMHLASRNMTFKNFIKNALTRAVVAERLRRLTRNQIPSGSAGSNPADCEIFSILNFRYSLALCYWREHIIVFSNISNVNNLQLFLSFFFSFFVLLDVILKIFQINLLLLFNLVLPFDGMGNSLPGLPLSRITRFRQTLSSRRRYKKLACFQYKIIFIIISKTI